jgi:hypothetical protein
MNKKEWLALIKSREEWGLTVNRKYCPQLKDVAVLRKLIKSGKIKRVRFGNSRTCRYTRLMLT